VDRADPGVGALSQDLELLVPPVLLEEFTRNRDRIEAAMSTNMAERFRLLRRDIVDYVGGYSDEALSWIDSLAHQVPMIGAMATRNFEDILKLLQKCRRPSLLRRGGSRSGQYRCQAPGRVLRPSVISSGGDPEPRGQSGSP
jgi:hypothetical protein